MNGSYMHCLTLDSDLELPDLPDNYNLKGYFKPVHAVPLLELDVYRIKFFKRSKHVLHRLFSTKSRK